MSSSNKKDEGNDHELPLACKTYGLEGGKTTGKKRPPAEQLATAATNSQGRKPPPKVERKRLREQRRRADLGQSFADLTTLLREIDPDFRDLTPQDASTSPASSPQGTSAFTRLDIMTHAISTLRRIHNENQLRKRIIEQISTNTFGLQSDHSHADSGHDNPYAGSERERIQLVDDPRIPGVGLQGPTPHYQWDRLSSSGTRFLGPRDPRITQILLNEQRADFERRLALAQYTTDDSVLSQIMGQRRSEMELALPESSILGINQSMLHPLSGLTLAQLSTVAPSTLPPMAQLHRLRSLQNDTSGPSHVAGTQPRAANDQADVGNDDDSSS